MQKRKRASAKITVIKSEHQQKAEKLIKQIKPYIQTKAISKTANSGSGDFCAFDIHK